MQSLLGFIGRALLSLIFIFSALHKLIGWPAAETMLHANLTAWQAHFMDFAWLHEGFAWAIEHVTFLSYAAIACELVGGVLLFLGILARLGAFLLFLFMVAVTFLFHSFWTFPSPESQAEMWNFMRNLSILGGLLLVLAWGKGKKSSSSDG